jgi:transcriptional regulator with XRE-family HTH domain
VINEFLLKEFGARVKMLRINQKISQEVLSHKTGFHRTYIGIAAFAKVFDISISELLDFSDIENNHSISDYETKSEI